MDEQYSKRDYVLLLQLWPSLKATMPSDQERKKDSGPLTVLSILFQEGAFVTYFNNVSFCLNALSLVQALVVKDLNRREFNFALE